MKFTNTFSVAGRCEETGALGVIVTSSSPSVGARCPWAKHGVGAILTQNVTDPRLANIGLNVLENGFDAESAINAMKEATPFREYRQLAVVDASGNSAVFTGNKALGVHGEFTAKNVASIGNLLSDPNIPEQMGKIFLDAKGTLADRLIAAISKGFEMGGELDQEHSIGLLVYQEDAFPYVDLRVDYSDQPLEDLKRAWEVYGPQAEEYRIRAITPEIAPSYGVLGDE
ncbi:DUF1028 domain-containing protein [Sporosarcina pasteurii]|uniref:Family of uncharacterized function (DUF1028) n=1 Tax=Sporosarcina pasteurii TaxID=1474 RepID=A0A380BML7_SPOPA|nr:DUF1028 domain-containing protein [Sporosarcina pasteurii]MDS9470940.1 DUF1028 domain-containing protein [Sporosarcina pasteurii]QBQ05405.1 DUF1028 domain-containing protein [Sporosarcina pasteurii]SUJ03400.1 Family of uncharacterised function (DUF1028) [Sporosarcina pasteurii]